MKLAEQLKKAVLQAAIQGKLTVQLPEGENAKRLLKKIKEYKTSLINNGFLQKEKHSISENSNYFDIPRNWEWCTLHNYAERITDYVASGSFKSLRENCPTLKTEDYALMVKTADFSNNFSLNLTYTTKHGYDFLRNSNLVGGELILSNIGGSIGKVFIVPHLNRPMTLAPNSIMIKCMKKEMIMYLYYYFISPIGYSQLMKIKSGSATPKFNKTLLKTISIPIPPLEEQKRIVEKLDQILPMIDALEKDENQLEEILNKFPENMKASILQAAIQGKLTEQLPEDGNAEDELKKFFGKKYKNVNIEDYPFEIPDNWVFCRLDNIFEINTGANFKKDQQINSKDGIRVLRGGNIIDNKYEFYDNDIFISKEIIKEKSILKKGDIITPSVTSLENVGKAALIEKDYFDVAGGGFVFIFRMEKINYLFSSFLHKIIISDYIRKEFKSRTNKSGQAFYNLGKARILDILVPIPPIEEQKRIVGILDQILPMIDTLLKEN